MAATQSLEEASEFISENSEEISKVVNGITGDSKDFKQAFSSINSILEDVNDNASTTYEEEKHTIKVGQEAEKNPSRESVKTLGAEHEREVAEVKSEEDELGQALKKIEGSEQLLEGDLEHLHECMDHTDDILRELNTLIESVNQQGLNAEKLEQLSKWVELAGGAIRLEAKAHDFIVSEVESLVKLNQEALVDMEEIETNIEGVERENQEEKELAQETGNKNLAQKEKKNEEKVGKEEDEFRKEEKVEKDILKELETELDELKEELSHAEDEMNNLENEIQALRSASQSMRQRMSGKISSEINQNFEDAERELQQASNIINNLEGEYSKVKDMVGKEESELTSL